ncbi:MAG: hypothetical protein U1E78_02995 [Gammaproteobacteria bacterium]
MDLLNNFEIEQISGGVNLEATSVWTIYGFSTDCVLDYISNHPATGLNDLDQTLDGLEAHCFNRQITEERNFPGDKVGDRTGPSYMMDFENLRVTVV